MAQPQLYKDLSAHQKTKTVCMFCHKNDDDELQFGKFYAQDGIAAHYYCLLFSSGLEQKGSDEEGIMGFLKQDILKEVRRGQKLNCGKCRHNGATVGCCNKACKKTYHFPCGAEKKMLNQYFGAFNSFCISHQPIQCVSVPVDPNSKVTCTICHEDVTASPSFDVLWAPCCKKQSWFHRLCVQKLALSAGYFFKCPICSDNTIFCKEMQRCGIYVPEQDASWELEPNAFQDLIQRHNKCDFPTCICPKGRTHDGEGTRWELLLCSSCGSKGIHIGCGKLDWATMDWDCEDCSSLVSRRINGNNEVVPVEPPPVPSVSFDNLLPHSAMKRSHPSDGRSTGESCSSGNGNDSEIDIISVADSESPSTSMIFPSAPPAKSSRNVARRGRAWVSNRSSNFSSKPSCNFDKLRFKVTEDSKNIIVYYDEEEGTSKSYTLPVDQPPIITPQKRKANKN